jgi:CubicO group peptidase (beta-lactamase class C family)
LDWILFCYAYFNQFNASKTKRLILKRLFLTCCVIGSLWSCKSDENGSHLIASKNIKKANTPTLPAEEKAKYHDLVAHFLDSTLLRGKFNGAILVAKNGVPVYEEYIGYRDTHIKDTLTATTAFQIASTSKPFTAAAILKLSEDGKIDINAPVSQYLPGFPYAEVTIKTLLNHRSGLPNYLYYMEKGGWERKVMASNTDIINTLQNWQPPRAYKPNTAFNYCNTNYVLLASIVEKVSGQGFPDYMRQTFFEPLEMKDTYVHTINDSARLAPSYDGFGSPWPLDFSDGPFGDKNVYSTPRDLLKWDQAWYNGVLSNAMMDSAFFAYSNEKPSMHNYGLGWRLLQLPNGKKVVYHHGRWHGFNSAFARLTDEKVTIIILTNKFNRSIYGIARKMYNLFGNYDNTNDHGEE